uniref:Uncharacterized protein n=1 Tax=Oryza meridionalis TaxID=40149 RepID=A0A0E0CLC6_9ORYZ
MEVFIHEEYVHKRREQRRRRGRRPAAVALQLLQVQSSSSTTKPEKKAAAAAGGRRPLAPLATELQDSPWDLPAGSGVGASPSDAAGSPPAAASATVSFADHLLGYL